MLAIIYNLTYDFDSCIATLRAKGMMAVARNIRENAQNSELRTMALLVMAYLVDEDSEDGHEEKNLLKMTDSELTFLIKELEIQETGCVEGLSKLKSSKHEEVRKAVDGALWQIQEKHHRNSKTVTVKKQIMLSYHHQSAEQVLKIRNILTSHGYKVWIDVDHITDGGSMLDAMSQGIQESYLVLIFISEAYKNSVYCRQYRYCLTNPRRCDVEVKAILSKIKHVIGSGSNGVRNKYRLPPPIPEAHSHKDDDDVTLEESLFLRTAQSFSVSLGYTFNSLRPSIECSSWTSQQVADWLDSSNLSQFKDSLSSYLYYHTLIGFYSFKEVDGEMLAELILLSRTTKICFTRCLNKTSVTHIADFLRFSCAARSYTCSNSQQ
ncbi:hypothetical protein EB796_012476 [Bugula neritina]|uniref:SAM domain-containing protein n=1 Tax=Bugula neritina TaxID=10212 RepID=A0A7J7JTA9_BUGNE|nr:hypothetical protein EB796_012476 [Bugula neritina]